MQGSNRRRWIVEIQHTSVANMICNLAFFQVVSQPGVLESFFPNEPKTVDAVRATYVGQWGLDKEDDATKVL